jgi:hypothetical protein
VTQVNGTVFFYTEIHLITEGRLFVISLTSAFSVVLFKTYIKMETFSVDKSFYDIGTSDLKELWDSDLDPVSVML